MDYVVKPSEFLFLSFLTSIQSKGLFFFFHRAFPEPAGANLKTLSLPVSVFEEKQRFVETYKTDGGSSVSSA